MELENLDEILREKRRKEKELVQSINENMEQIKMLRAQLDSPFTASDKVYRFYHSSHKVYGLQDYTVEIVTLLLSFIKGAELHSLHPYFIEIFKHGTFKTFQTEDNARWMYETRPILEAYHHAKHMLDIAYEYGQKSADERAGNSTWMTLLYFYRIR